MPLGNLDYLFELSNDNKYGLENSTVKPNLVIASKNESANAGFFMLTPGYGEYEEVQEIIQTREAKARDLDSEVKFDVVDGWGHVITEPDEWVSRSSRRGRHWNFSFAYSDQGLLYYWVKYMKKQVSVVFEDHVDNLSEDENGNVALERTLKEPFRNLKPILDSPFDCRKFMCDFVHFTGNTKPWMDYTPKEFLNNRTEPHTPNELWWYTLKQLNKKMDMGLDLTTGRILAAHEVSREDPVKLLRLL